MRETKQHCIEVHVAGICLRETEYDIEVLIAKRRENKELYPGKWECGSGQVKEGENFEEAIKRKIKEELGVIVERVLVFGTYEIKTPQLPQKKIPGIKFVCFLKGYVNGKEPQIKEDAFSDWKWQSINNLSGTDFIPGIKDEINTAWEFYSKNKNLAKKV
jgi:8-oxo-dGTP pyrophosphatase MutT (NUDIX family)